MQLPSEELLTLLALAAHLRAGGASWETVAARAQRPVDDCRDWPRMHPETWQPLFRQAEQQVRSEGRAESIVILRKWLRDEDGKTSLGAAALLLKPGSSARDGDQTRMQSDHHLDALRFVTYCKGLDDAELEKTLAEHVHQAVHDHAGEARSPGARPTE